MNHIAYVIPMTQGIVMLRELTLFPDIVLNWSLLLTLIAEAIVLFIAGKILYETIIRLLLK